MSLKNRFYIYAENWPTGNHVPATGLDRALVPVCAALEPLRPLVLLKASRRCLRYPLHPDLVPRASRAGILALIADDLRQRAGLDYGGYSLSCQDLARRIAPSPGGVLFSVLGGDGRAYLRADRMARQANLTHVIYSVDDPIAWAEERRDHLPRLTAASPAVEEVLRSASAILAISDGLANSLRARLDRAVAPLPLPYLLEFSVQAPRKQQVIFVGNVSHLYADAFISTIDAAGALRAKGIDISFRATATLDNIRKIIPNIPDYVVIGRIQNREDLAREIASSAVAICPISFHPEQEMVRTSFPSKILDYLAYARAIVVHGPSDSAAQRYFAENGLGYTTNSQEELERTLSRIVIDDVNHTTTYRNCLKAHHGLTQFRDKVLAAMPQGANLDGIV